MKRAIYIGKQIENGKTFLNYGITGDAGEIQDDGVWNFYPDGQDSMAYVREKDLYFSL